MTGTTRAERLMALYRLRTKVAAEIATLESVIDLETEALTRARHELCGTDSGYHHHRRIRKEPACTPCRRAHSAYEAGRARRQREAS